MWSQTGACSRFAEAQRKGWGEQPGAQCAGTLCSSAQSLQMSPCNPPTPAPRSSILRLISVSSEKNCTLAIIKPDAVVHGKAEEIVIKVRGHPRHRPRILSGAQTGIRHPPDERRLLRSQHSSSVPLSDTHWICCRRELWGAAPHGTVFSCYMLATDGTWASCSLSEYYIHDYVL